MNLVFSSLFSFIMAFFVFSVMSDFSLDDPGFTPPVPPVSPLSISSVETPVDGSLLGFMSDECSLVVAFVDELFIYGYLFFCFDVHSG